MTYQYLDPLSQAFADSLEASAGWRIGQVVTLEADPDLFVVPLLGIWKAAGVTIPVPPIDDPTGDAKALGETIRGLTQREHVVSGDGIGHAIYFTSGSTGSPRAVLRGWRQARFEAGRYSELLGLREKMEATMLIAPWFGASTKHFLGCLLSGRPQRFGNEFPGDSDLLQATPAHPSTLVRTQGHRTRYRWISLTGGPIQPEARSAIQSLAMPDGKVLNALSGTEFGVVLNQTFPARQPQNDLIGNPPAGKRLVLLSDNGTPVAPGEPGRLFVESEFVAEGYIDLDKGTVESVPIRSESISIPRLPTGDLAVAEESGIRLLPTPQRHQRGEVIGTGSMPIDDRLPLSAELPPLGDAEDDHEDPAALGHHLIPPRAARSLNHRFATTSVRTGVRPGLLLAGRRRSP